MRLLVRLPFLLLLTSSFILDLVLATAQFAIACKLNEVSSPMLSEFPSSIAGVPRDAIELGEWVGTFWQVLILEKKLALVRGVPSSLRDEVSVIFSVVCIHISTE